MSAAVPPGYKQTEVGVIPEDWEVTKLGNHAAFRTGPFGSALHKSDYVENGIPVINPMQIIDGKLEPTPTMSITEEAAEKLTEFRLPVGSVIIGRRGEMGRCAFVEKDQHGWLCGTGSMIIRPANTLDGRYLQRIVSSPLIIKAIENNSVGTTMINLNQGTLSGLNIPFPPTKLEQQAIAEALSDADALIEGLEALIAKKRRLRQGAFYRLFERQKDWAQKKLGDICNIEIGRTPARRNPAFWGKGHQWLSIADLKTKYVCKSKEEITELAAVEMKTVRAGTLLMSFKLSIGRLCFAGCDLYTNEAICSFNQPQADVNFLYYVLGQLDFSLYGKQAVKGYTLNKASLKDVSVPLPEEREQVHIATVLSDMDAEIAALEGKLAKARRVKAGMMQDLLTGRVRLV